MLQGGRGGGFSNEWDNLDSGDNLTSYHIRPMEACGLYTPVLQSLLEDQANSSLPAPGSHGGFRQTHHGVSDPIVTINLIGDLDFCQHHKIVIGDLNRLNGLGKAKDLYISDAIRPKV